MPHLAPRATPPSLLLLLAALTAFACSDTPAVESSTGDADDDQGIGDFVPEDDDTPAADDDAAGADDDQAPPDIIVDPPEPVGDDDSTPVVQDPCDGTACDIYTHCVDNAGTAECVPNVCADMDCGEDAVCETATQGDFCRTLLCEVDVECA